MKVTIYCLVISMTACLLSGCGYGTIRGVVVDDAGNALVDVNVYTDPPTQSVLTDETGYTIRGVPVGIYTIRGAKIGYRTNRRDVEVRRNRILNGDLQLRRTLE